jgi:hypothetical protein
MQEEVDGCPRFAPAYLGRKGRGAAPPLLYSEGAVKPYGGSTNKPEVQRSPAPAQARSSLGDQ